jgi:hypothetical protein
VKLAVLETSFAGNLLEPFLRALGGKCRLQLVVPSRPIARHFQGRGTPVVCADWRQKAEELAELSDSELLLRLQALCHDTGIEAVRSFFWADGAYRTGSVFHNYDERDLWVRTLAIAATFDAYLEAERPDFVIQNYGAELERRLMRVLCDRRGVGSVFLEYVPFLHWCQPVKSELGGFHGVKLRTPDMSEVRAYVNNCRSGSLPYLRSDVAPSSFRRRLERFRRDPERFSLLAGFAMSPLTRYLRRVRKGIDEMGIPREIPEERTRNRRVFLYPVQTPEESTVTLRSNGFVDQTMVIGMLSLFLPVNSILVVRLHPHYERGFAWRQWMEMPNVLMTSHAQPLDTVLKKSDAVVTINSTVGYEALVRGIPVVSLGWSVYSGFGVTIDVPGVRQLGGCLERALAFRPAEEQVQGMVSEWFACALKGCLTRDTEALADDLVTFCHLSQDRRAEPRVEP